MLPVSFSSIFQPPRVWLAIFKPVYSDRAKNKHVHRETCCHFEARTAVTSILSSRRYVHEGNAPLARWIQYRYGLRSEFSSRRNTYFSRKRKLLSDGEKNHNFDHFLLYNFPRKSTINWPRKILNFLKSFSII